MKKIVITAGHAATTALSVIEELHRQADLDICFIGTKKAIEGKSHKTLEYRLSRKYGFKFFPITAGRLQRRFTIHTIPSIFKIPVSFVQALFLLIKINPQITLSFGGFAAFPVVVMSWILGIPVVIHEQTSVAGLANRLSAPFAKRIAISRKSSLDYFPKDKCVLTGNPISSEIARIKPKGKLSKTPTILITGGSRGASRINKVVDRVMPTLLQKYKVIHLTGSDSFSELNKYKNRHKIYKHVGPNKMAEFYKQADIVIARSGANTTSEIIVAARPAILIPIPWARYNEQLKNARLAQELGIALILEEDDLSPKKLLKAIQKVTKDWDKMVSSSLKEVADLDRGAARHITELLA